MNSSLQIYPSTSVTGPEPNLIFSKSASDVESRLRPHFSTTFNVPPISIETIPDALIQGRFLSVTSLARGLHQDSIYLNGSTGGWIEQILKAPGIDRLAGNGRRLVFTANPGYRNYYHWTMQCVAAAVLAANTHGHENISLVTPPLDSLRRQVLEIFGLRAVPTVELTPPSDRLIYASSVEYSNVLSGCFAFSPHPDFSEMLYRTVSANLGPQLANSRRQVYLSRQDAKKRRVTNSAEVQRTLELRGIEIVQPAKLSVTDQINVVRDSTLIVAPHGAALTNIIYCQPGTTIIELFSDAHINTCYFRLAQARRLKYVGIINPAATPEDRLSDFSIDQNCLAEALSTYSPS